MKMIREGHSYSEIAKELGLKNERVIRNLVYRIKHPKENSLPKKTWKKIKGKSTSTGFSLAHRKGVKTSVKYKVIFRHKDIYSISEMCHFFEVSRSGYYDFVNKLDIPANVIDEYIYFYNYQRIQTKTKLTPMELRCQFVNS